MTPNQRKAALLDDIAARSPEYGEVFALFRGIFSYTGTRQGETGISFAPDLTNRTEMIQGGFPLLTAESMVVDIPCCVAFLTGLLAEVEAQSRDGKAELQRVAKALANGELDLPPLFAAILQRDRRCIDAASEACNLPSSLLEFLLETVLKTALEPFASRLTETDFEGWQEGYCPVCGSRAGMGELVGDEGRRYLSCCTCFFKWPYKRLECPYCHNDDTATLSYFMVDEGPTRVDICRKCSRYLKTRDSRKGNGDVPLEVEDLATIHLDLVAGREGFERGK